MSNDSHEVEGSEVDAVRGGAGLFELPQRGLVSVGGGDRVRWLNGMVSGDVEALAPGPQTSGCYATHLTNKGAIVTDLQILLQGDAIWLEADRGVIPDLISRLDRYIIADDVVLTDLSESYHQLTLEGPEAPRVLGQAIGVSNELPSPNCAIGFLAAGRACCVASFGWTGEQAFRLFVPVEARAELETRLVDAAESLEGPSVRLIKGSAALLETLRIESGTPLFPAELSDILPPEAGLERAISYSKGCYIGQEIIARLQSRGHVNHRLVAWAIAGDSLPAAGAKLRLEDRDVGRLTSVCRSPSKGVIALGFVRAKYAEAGTVCDLDGTTATVSGSPIGAAPQSGEGPT